MQHTQYGFGPPKQPIAWTTSSRILDAGWYAASAFYLKPELPKEVDPDAVVAEKKANKGWTEPPRRFSEAALIGALEELRIGRPSTYAVIVPVLNAKSYSHPTNTTLQSTLKGQVANFYLGLYFPELVDPTFTSRMEEMLDKVEQGEITRKEALQAIWSPIAARIDTVPPLQSEDLCPKCQTELKVAGGPSLWCPACKVYYGIDMDLASIKRFEPRFYPGECKECHAPKLEMAQSKYGRYVWCRACKKIQ
jgi:hypothetical protein